MYLHKQMQRTTVQCCNLKDGSGKWPTTNQNTSKQTDRQTDQLLHTVKMMDSTSAAPESADKSEMEGCCYDVL